MRRSGTQRKLGAQGGWCEVGERMGRSLYVAEKQKALIIFFRSQATKEDKENLPSVHKIYSVVEMTKS